MSVDTGISSSFVSDVISRPYSSQDCGSDSMLVRFALSNEALKTKLTPSSCAVAFRVLAIANANSWDCSTQGPAISSNGQPGPQRYGPISIGSMMKNRAETRTLGEGVVVDTTVAVV